MVNLEIEQRSNNTRVNGYNEDSLSKNDDFTESIEPIFFTNKTISMTKGSMKKNLENRSSAEL